MSSDKKGEGTVLPAPAQTANTESSPENLREGPERYLAYLNRIRTFAIAKARYAAYSSDVGEGLRPVLSPMAVNAFYGLSIAYIASDIGYVTKKEYDRGSPNWVVARTCAQGTVFQGLASLTIPYLMIHNAVGQSSKYFKKIGRFTKWGPSVVGLAMIPLMPLVDEPIEHIIESAFDWAIPLPDEYKHHHETGNEHSKQD
eukprot:m.340103 g.340103  ORF g.340103 m.340103 type:complete len:200 (-) comp19133_c0_seq1:94-693(-)